MRAIHSIKVSRVFYRRDDFSSMECLRDVLYLPCSETDAAFIFILRPTHLLDMETLERKEIDKGVWVYTAEAVDGLSESDTMHNQPDDENGDEQEEAKEQPQPIRRLHRRLHFDSSSICRRRATA